MALCLPFHCPLCWLLCSSSLGARACGGALCVGRVCAEPCPQHSNPNPLCSIPRPCVDESLELCRVTCRFIYLLCCERLVCTESIPAPSAPGTWSHNLGHSRDGFNFPETSGVAGSPVQEQRMCSLPSVAKLYCGSLFTYS